MNTFASSESEYELPPDIYRRFLMLTCAWPGTRALPGSLVIKFQSGSAEEPLFWCGGPDDLSAIGETLAEKRSIFYMRGTYGILPPTREFVQALGRYYATEMIKIQPYGAYHIGGFCEAGFIAYEIAQILMARGYQVKLLALFERDLTAAGRLLSMARGVFSLIGRASYRWARLRQHLNTLVQGSHVVDTLPDKPVLCPQGEVPYSLTPYPGRAVLIYIRWGPFGLFRFRIFQKYWEKIVLGGTDFRIIPGYFHHLPNWPVVAKILESLFDEFENSGQHDADIAWQARDTIPLDHPCDPVFGRSDIAPFRD
jgi:hypothetical protein